MGETRADEPALEVPREKIYQRTYGVDQVPSTSTFHLVYTCICIGCVLAVGMCNSKENRTTPGIPVAIVLLTVDQKDLIGNR